jgi:signal transduction histidine kinase
LFTVMFGLLLLSLAVVVVASGRFLQNTSSELMQDQAKVAKDIVDQSVDALESQGESSLDRLVRDKAKALDQSFEEVERIVNFEALTAERLLADPEEAHDLALVSSADFADPARRPKDFKTENGKNRKVSLSTVIWHRPDRADVQATDEELKKLKGLGFTMKALYQDDPLSSFIYIGTANGLFIGYPSDDSMDRRYDPRTRDWYVNAKRRGALSWSVPYVDPSGALTITCSRPFYSPGTHAFAGVASVDVTVDQLNAMIGELEEGLHGYAFLLDAQGVIMTSPEIKAGGTRWDQVFETTNLLEDKDPELAAIAKKMVADESGLAKLHRTDGDRYLAYDHIASTDWSLGVLLPVSEIVEPAKRHQAALQDLFRQGQVRIAGRVDETRNRFLRWGIVGVFFLLMWTTGFFYVRLTHPIRSFIGDIRAVSKGDLERKVHAPHDNELADLAAAFNDMTAEVKRSRDQIEEYSRNLERKVEARTAELAASNSELAETIRKLQDAQSRLVHSEKMASLGQLVAGIAHEINNPVNFIANSVAPLQTALDDLARVQELYDKGATKEDIEELKRDIGFDGAIDQMRRALELIKTGSSRTKAIVLQLRNFSRLDEAEMKDADIHEGLDGSLALLNYKLKDKIEVERDYGQVGRLTCYPGQLNQVFMNILANAIQAIEPAHPSGGGKIRIRTRRERETVTVAISDNGPGIPANVIPKIFDPFFTTKDREKGTGLGLSISHGIVEKHGGRIDVTSEVGKGTDFVITLPAAVMAKTGARA